MPDLSPAETLRAAATRLRAALASAPPCQHPGCGHYEGWHKEDADGITVCTDCDYDAHDFINPGLEMPDGVGEVLAEWLELDAGLLEVLEVHDAEALTTVSARLVLQSGRHALATARAILAGSGEA